MGQKEYSKDKLKEDLLKIAPKILKYTTKNGMLGCMLKEICVVLLMLVNQFTY